MFKHILLPIDGSELSLRAVKVGMELAQTCHARVYALHVIAPFRTLTYMTEMLSTTESIYMELAEARAVEYLAEVRRQAEAANVRYDDGYALGESPHESIITTATEQQCDLVVMASHGWRGITRLLLGSETQKLLLKGDVPVLVCH